MQEYWIEKELCFFEDLTEGRRDPAKYSNPKNRKLITVKMTIPN